MYLTCPSCGARFIIEDDQLGSGGRRVRCGRCRHVWFAESAEGEPETAAPPSEEPEPETEPAAPPPAEEPEETPAEAPKVEPEAPRAAAAAPPPAGHGILVGWIALVVVLVAIAAGLWFGRDTVVATVPETARLYRMAGIPLTVGQGLEFRQVTRDRRLVDGDHVLVIEGQVVNHTDETRRLPLLRAALLDGQGQVLTEWTFEAASSTVGPGGAARFVTEARDPPREAKNLNLTFVARTGGG